MPNWALAASRALSAPRRPFLGLVERHLRREPIGDQTLLPLKIRLCYPQLDLCGRHRCGRGIQIGLLLGRIEPSQDIASLNMDADIDKAREDAAADAKRQIGAKTGLDFTGKRDRSLSVPRLHNLRAHKRRRFGCVGAIVAGTERTREKRHREYSAQVLSGLAGLSASNAKRERFFMTLPRDGSARTPKSVPLSSDGASSVRAKSLPATDA